jgi:ribonuclease HI
VTVYTDGGCEPNPGPGGWGALLRFSEHEVELDGNAPQTTNNRMELEAAVAALAYLDGRYGRCQVELHTDSRYLRQGITKWVDDWFARGWKTRNGQPVKNQLLWRRLYELARKGETVEREPRPIRIDSIELLEAAGTRLVFRVRCSKGTYIRSLVEDLAARAGTVAHTARLHRETVGVFEPDDMLTLTAVEALAAAGPEALRARLAGADTALRELPRCAISDREAERFRAGQAVRAGGPGAEGLVRVYADAGEFLGVAELSAAGTLMPRRVFLGAEKNP